MSSVVELLRSRSRAVVLTALAVGVAGCSADSTRFDIPFASRNAPGEASGSVAPGQAAPVSRVDSTQLPPPTASRPTPVATETGIAGGSRGMGTYQPAPAASPEVTGSVPAPPARKPAPPPPPQWTWDGGTAVMVAQGESIDVIARRHRVPASAIMQANGLTAPAILYAGQRLIIPRRQQTAAAQGPAPVLGAPAARPAAAKPAPVTAGGMPGSGAAAPAQSGVHVVVAGDTLSKISRLYHKPVNEIAKANNIQPQAMLNIGDRIIIPATRTSSAQGNDAPKEVAAAVPTPPAAPAPKAAPPAPKQNAAPKQQPGNPQPTETASVVSLPAAASAR